jgi:GDP-4-dehydro-6-deoxy-D-mannose reductase
MANLAGLASKVKVDRFDITDPEACRSVFAKARPEYLFHLAAVSSVGQSFSMPETTFRINVIGSHNIFEAIRKRRPEKIVFISSSDVYGPVRPGEMPLKPDRLFNPISPYAQSKAAAEYLARIYVEHYQVPLTIVRPFNHTGPRQNPNFAIPAFCRKIVAAEKSGGKKSVKVGNLKARRDISDVRDIVRGYRLIAEKGKVDRVYHLCSGKAHAIGDLLNKLIGFTDTSIKVERDAGLYRKADIPVLRGSYHRIRKDLGWKPEIAIDRTLKDTLDFWRRQG